MKFILQKAILIIFLWLGIVSCNFEIKDSRMTIFPFEEDQLEIPDTIKIRDLINDTSVGRNLQINGKTFFIPINYEAGSASIGKPHRVLLADLVITNNINKYKPVRFRDEFERFGESRVTFLFFVPSNDPMAISKEKLANQFKGRYLYIDKNSLITKDYMVLNYKYFPEKSGFEIFESTAIPFSSDITATEKLYQSIDILRMAKHLKDTTVAEFNWEKSDFIIPPYFHRYFRASIVDSIIENTKKQPNDFTCKYIPEDLELEFSIVKDSSLVSLLEDMQKAPIQKGITLENDFSKESVRILKEHIERFKIDKITRKTDKNTFFITEGFDHLILHFIPKKKILLVIEDTDSFNSYNNEIYYNYLSKILIPKLEK